MTGHLHQLPVRDDGPVNLIDRRSVAHDLLRRCREDDPGAWEELVERYERLVFGVARREGLDQDDAADVVQTVFEALITSMDKIREGERIAAWLLAVTRRHSWRARNRRLRERPVAEMETELQPLDPRVGAPARDDSDRVIDLYEALQDLSPRCRDLVSALYFDPSEPSYEQVAVRMGRPVGSIGPSRARCLERLRRILEDAR
jgi:RNA polymerase sigma factor (sigma-70 family)